MRTVIKAIFFDIDGTLRDFETGKIPESARKVLSAAHETGIRLFVATGRHKLEMEEETLLEGLRFDGYVTLNGQYCYSESDTVFKWPIDKADVAAMLHILEREPFPCMFMERDRMYINFADELVKRIQEGIKTRIPPVCDVGRAREHEIFQIVPYIDQEAAERIRTELSDCEFIRWHDGKAFDVVQKNGGKSVGIQAMARHFGLSLDECAAVGDGENDVSMVKAAGLGIAMGNGKECVKAAADFVTDSIEHDGLWKAVFYILEKNHQEE